jgi:hypothetical protein
MTTMKLPTIAVVILTLTGCATPPTAQQLVGADYGDEPTQYQEIIKNYMGRRLRDPDTARYEFSMTPVKAWYGASTPKQYGWAVCAHINSKNGFGGYTGQRKSYFFMRDGYVQESRHAGEPGGIEEAIVYEMCSKL